MIPIPRQPLGRTDQGANIKYWLTTHFPHPDPDSLPWHIYLQKHHKSAVAGIAVGHLVYFYEYKYQKPIKNAPKYPTGAEGIVRFAIVSGSIYDRDTVIEHTDGTKAYWFWGVPTSKEDDKGFVERAKVLSVLGYKPGGYLRGFNNGTGVKELEDEQGRRLMELFRDGFRNR